MGSSKYVYIGVYFKVFMPKEECLTGGVLCKKCGKTFYGGFSFCPQCGSKTDTVTSQRMKNFGDFLLDVFGDEDKFSTGNIDAKDFFVAMANSADQPGYSHVSDRLEQSIPSEDYSGDWIELGEALDAQKIPYEKHFGVIVYWM